MKKLILGIILALAMLVPFINNISSTADSSQDWTLGIVIIVVVVAFGCWLMVRWYRSEKASDAAAAAPTPVTGGDVVRSEAFSTTTAAAPVCSNCGAVSRGTRFCPECGKLFVPKNVCSQCGAQLQSGIKFCPECGHKIF